MNNTEKAMRELDSINELQSINSPIRNLSPLAKLIVTIFYIYFVISINKYDLSKTILYIIYPFVIYSLSYIKIRTCFYKLRFMLPMIIMLGIANPIIDKEIIQGLNIRIGYISMLVLILKGIYCLMSSFILIATTPIEELCFALRKLQCPKFITTLLLLTYRYIFVLLQEVDIMFTAYKLRAPKQKGLHFSVWGTFLGQLILRTMDRANVLYDSMQLRGYDGNFYFIDKKYSNVKSIIFVLLMLFLFVVLEYLNPIMIGV